MGQKEVSLGVLQRGKQSYHVAHRPTPRCVPKRTRTGVQTKHVHVRRQDRVSPRGRGCSEPLTLLHSSLDKRAGPCLKKKKILDQFTGIHLVIDDHWARISLF